MKKVMSWVAGIAATVISSVLIYRFTTPKAVPPPPAPMVFEGMVIDGAQNAPLKGAMVTFEVKDSAPNTGPLHDFTDDHGSYRKDFSGLDKASTVVLHAQANGFKAASAFTFSALGDDNRRDFVLLPLPGTGPNGRPAPEATPHPELLVHPPLFIQKMATPVIRIQLQRKP